MYAKFAAAMVCIALCSLNVVAAVKRTPIRTTIENSTRTTVEMMPSQEAGLHWASAVIFLASFACFLSWGISDYNNGIDSEKTPDELVNSSDTGVSSSGGHEIPSNPYYSDLPARNVVPFARSSSGTGFVTPPPLPVSSEVSNNNKILSPEEFYTRLLLEEDFWKDDEMIANSQFNDNSAS